MAQTYLQLLLRQWGAGNVYLLVLSSWKVNIAVNLIAVNGVIDMLSMVVLELVILIGQAVTMPELIYHPITTMGFSAMFTFQLDNTRR